MIHARTYNDDKTSRLLSNLQSNFVNISFGSIPKFPQTVPVR